MPKRQRTDIFRTGLFVLIAGTLVVFGGCKKDEPEETASPEPEKVSAASEESDSADDEAGSGKKSSLKSALEAKSDTDDSDAEDAPKRRLVKAKKGADKNKAKLAKKGTAKKDAVKTGKAAEDPTSAGPRSAKLGASDKPGKDLKLARAVPPARKPAVRPSRAEDEDDEGDDFDEDLSARNRGPHRAGAKLPKTRRPVNRRGDEEDTADADEPAELAGAKRRGERFGRSKADRRNGARDRGPRGRDRASDRDRGSKNDRDSRYDRDRRPARRARADDKRSPTALPSRVRPNAEILLRKADLVEVLEIKKAVDVHQLSGIETGDEYDGIYWGSPNGLVYMAGVQIWRPRSPIEAQRRYSRMSSSYPNAEENTAITNKTFLAHWNDFIYLVFFDTSKQTVVSLTCSRTVCDSPQKLVILASRIKERL